jgi:hypothetical protein
LAEVIGVMIVIIKARDSWLNALGTGQYFGTAGTTSPTDNRMIR